MLGGHFLKFQYTGKEDKSKAPHSSELFTVYLVLCESEKDPVLNF